MAVNSAIGDRHEDLLDRSHPRRRHRQGGRSRPASRCWPRIAKREGSFAFKFDHFDWGGEYYKKHGRMMPENGREQICQARRDPVRLGRRSRHPRPHHAVGPAARDLPALRPVRQRAADAHPARHHLAAARRQRRRARLGDRARELGGRIFRRRRPRAPGLAARGRDRRRRCSPAPASSASCASPSGWRSRGRASCSPSSPSRTPSATPW